LTVVERHLVVRGHLFRRDLIALGVEAADERQETK